MKNIILFLVAMTPALMTANVEESQKISSQTAISQTGNFSVTAISPMTIDLNASSQLTNFIAYREIASNDQVLIGGVPGNHDLNFVCHHPTFLADEKIATLSAVSDRDIEFVDSQSPASGCLISIDKQRSVLIISRPEIFSSKNGDPIAQVAIVANKEKIPQLQSTINFQIEAKDFYVNLLQLSQAFSFVTKQIDWDSLKTQGVEFIGDEKPLCRGLAAATKFLAPALNNIDLHSSISFDPDKCPMCSLNPNLEDEDMKKWLSVPKETRNKIISYASDFHGRNLDGGIAYLYIPAIEAYDPTTINEKIKNGRAALATADVNKACGVIVDLRFNTGGSLQSMLLTLGGVLPRGHLLSLGKNSPLYLSEDGNKLFISEPQELYGQYSGDIPYKNRNKPVAILTNWMTASSGEFTRLALRDRAPLAKVFGTNTSPTASVNQTFYLLDGSVLNLMVDRAYNFRGDVVPLSLPVDQRIEDVPERIFDPRNDETIKLASNWLMSLPGCYKK